ncbi:MAG: hypothetical protein JST16_17920, partial [Bdellovibrionales bacterium]|nr:hypothetical protein [Bdellovibrionales bacterium]
DLAGVAGFFDLPDAAPAARFFTNEHNAGLLAELLALLAGQSEGDTSYLPGSLFRAAPDIVNDAYEYREASDNEELYSATDIPTPLAQRTQKVNEISQRLLTHVLEASKYRDGGFSQGDLTRFLTRLKEQPPVWRDKALELRFEPNSLARRIFRFKNAFLGSGEQLFGKQTLGSLRTYLVNLSIDSPILYHEWDARKAIPESIRTLPSAGNNLWTFFDQFKGPIIGYDGPAYLYGQPKDQGTVYLSKVISLYRNLQVTSAAIQSFDDNGNYALDLVNGQVDDEFRRLIKFFSVFDNISQQFAPAEKDADRSNGKKQDSPKSATDIADDAVAHEGRLDQMLNHPLLGSGLVFIVDNFGVFGNGDGALNGAELRELVDFVDEVASAPEHFDRTRKYFAQYYCSNEAYEHILSKDPPRGWTPTCLDYVGYDGGYTLINKIPLFSAAQVQFSTTEWAVFFGEHLSPDYLKPQARATYDQYGNQLAAAFEILREFKFGQSDMGMRYALPAAFAKLTGTILTNTSPLKRPSKITYEQVQKFLGSRLGPGSLSWLDAKFQLLLLMAPPQLTSELVVRMLWNAPQVRDFALHRSAGDGDWKKQLVNLLSKLESPKPNAAISPEELSLRALQLASALNLLLPADQPTTH